MQKALLGLVIVIGLALVVMLNNDWLNISGNKSGVNISVDKEKAVKDLKAGTQAVKEGAAKATEAVKEGAQKVGEAVKEGAEKVKEGAEKVKEKVVGTKPN